MVEGGDINKERDLIDARKTTVLGIGYINRYKL